MSAAPPPARPLGDVLRAVLQRVDPQQQLPAFRIWSFWNDEVGPAIARRAQPARFRNGTLFVTVASHSWLQELQFMKAALRDRLNARLHAPLVRDICFESGAVAEPAAPVEAPAPPPVHPVDALPAIADPELAAAFHRVVQARARRMARPMRRRNRTR